MTNLPYFDQLLLGRRRSKEFARVFERYVHWGYWENPKKANRDLAELVEAMGRLDHEIVAACSIQHGQAVLDAGCGFGGTLAAISASWRDMRLTGLNIDPRQLEIARTQCPGVTFVEGDACALPFDSGSFDRVLAVECISHFPSRLRFLQEAARVLKPGGRLALSDFIPKSLSASRGWLGRAIQRKIGQGYGKVADWAAGNYRNMASAAGLRVVLERDITRNTLPTYPAVLHLLRAWRAAGEGIDHMSGPTHVLHWVSKLGQVRYKIVAFEKDGTLPNAL